MLRLHEYVIDGKDEDGSIIGHISAHKITCDWVGDYEGTRIYQDVETGNYYFKVRYNSTWNVFIPVNQDEF